MRYFYLFYTEQLRRIYNTVLEIEKGTDGEFNVKKKKYITKPMYSRTLLYSIVNVTVEICYDECRGDSNEE